MIYRVLTAVLLVALSTLPTAAESPASTATCEARLSIVELARTQVEATLAKIFADQTQEIARLRRENEGLRAVGGKTTDGEKTVGQPRGER